MNKRQMQRYRKLLVAKREELLVRVRAARNSEQEADDKEAPDLGDRALSTVIRDLSYQLTAGERDMLRRIDEALDRIEEGQYGVRQEGADRPARRGALGPALHRVPGAPGPWRALSPQSRSISASEP
jgi:DnaK suppressor protein